MKRSHQLALSALFFAFITAQQPTYSATPVNLRVKPMASLLKHKNMRIAEPAGVEFREISKAVDFNGTEHIRIQQLYQGVAVFGADAVIHQPANQQKSLMNGIVYHHLAADLQGLSASYFTDTHKKQSLITAIDAAQKIAGKRNISHSSTELIVYIDDQDKAHWAYQIILTAATRNHLSKPAYIIDALTQHIYLSWDNLQRVERENALGSGYGGNSKMGRITFDGVNGNPGPLSITRNPATQTCFLQDAMVTVYDDNTGTISNYPCASKDNQRGNTYWNSTEYSEEVGAYAPENDLFYNTHTLIKMFDEWYKMPLLKKPDNTALPIIIHAHTESTYHSGLSFWNIDKKELIMGNGFKPYFLSLTTFDVLAHELGHAIVSQYSNLQYPNQSGALNESFGDMLAIAAEYYTTGTTNWMIGHTVFLQGDALRYIDDPHKDCNGMNPIQEVNGKKTRICSASHMSEIENVEIEFHNSNGVFNKAFYLIAQGYGGDKNEGIRKAFNIMMQANMHYWTSRTSFAEAACGVMKSANDYAYDQVVVTNAFAEVGIDVTTC